MPGVLIKDSRREEDHVKMEAVIGVIQSQAKEHLEPPESGRGKEIFHPRAFGGSMTLQIP